MTTFDENGFLSGRIQSWIDSHRTSHCEMMDRARELNRDCHRFLDGRIANSGNGKQIATGLFFARMLELFQSIVLISERGMAATTRILERALLEANYIFMAAHRDPTFLDEYMAQHHIHKRKLVKKIRLSNSSEKAMMDLKQGATDQVLKEVEAAISQGKLRELRIEEIAKRAGCHDSYCTAYAILSQAVHTGVNDIDRYIDDKETDGRIRLKHGPSDEETLRAIALAGMTMAEALELASETFGEDRKELCEAYVKAFQSFIKV